MGTGLQSIGPKTFKAGPVDITVSGDSRSLQALAGVKTPFPSWDVPVGGISVAATTGKDIEFSGESGSGTVRFSASASADAGFGLYADPAQMIADLKLEPSLASGLNLKPEADRGFCVLKWAYDLQGSAEGSVALGGPASVTFGVDGSRAAVYAVLRRFDRATASSEVIQGTVDSWKIPIAIRSVTDIAPATWLVAEVDGTIALKLAASYGYNFNWVRQLQLGSISGDVGLKLNAGLSLALGFEASGRFATVISREPDDPGHLRVRLFKLRKKGWDFALNGGVSVTGVENAASEGEFYSFVQAIFGAHGLQVVQDLKAVRDWTDPQKPLSGKLASMGLAYFQSFLKEVTGIDPNVAFDSARRKILDLLDQWDELDAQVTSVLWSYAKTDTPLKAIGEIARKISQLDQESVQKLIEPYLSQVDFFTTATGKWLEAAAEGHFLTALNGVTEFRRLQQVAATTANIADGSELRAVLTKLHQAIDNRLSLNQIEAAIKASDPSKVDAWLATKLAAVLGPVDSIPALTNARDIINKIISKGQEFYDKSVTALNETYKFSLTATYESTTAKTALIDASFDLSDANGAERYRDLLHGKFDELLLRRSSGVSLQSAVLSHNLERQSHVEIKMPFYSRTSSELAESLANLKVVNGSDGRVLIYELDSHDEIIQKNRLDSRLAIAAFYSTGEIRTYSNPKTLCSYSYRYQHARIKRAELQYQLKPYLDAYLPRRFRDDTEASFSVWLGDLDKYIDAKSFNGTDNFGDTRISLQVTWPPDIASFWFHLDAARTAERSFEMSRGFQVALRRLILSYHFSDPMHYADLTSAPQLLVYAALPISTGVKLQAGQLQLNANNGTYWNYREPDILRAMVYDWHTAANLSELLRGITEVVQSVPELRGMRGYYKPDQAYVLQRMALDQYGSGQAKLNSLLLNEKELIDAALDAVNGMLAFLRSSHAPTKAIETLARFGDKVTSTFNGLDVYTGDAVRPLGPLLISTMAQTLCPGLIPLEPSAMLSISVMNNGIPLPPITEALKPQDVVIEQRIVSE